MRNREVSYGAKVQPRHLKVLRCGVQMARSIVELLGAVICATFIACLLRTRPDIFQQLPAEALTLLLSVCLERLSSLYLDPPTDSRVQAHWELRRAKISWASSALIT